MDEPGLVELAARDAASAEVEGAGETPDAAEPAGGVLKTGTSEGGFEPGKVFVCCDGFAAVEPAGAPAMPGDPLWFALGRIAAPGAAGPTDGEVPVIGDELKEPELAAPPDEPPIPPDAEPDEELDEPPDELPPPPLL